MLVECKMHLLCHRAQFVTDSLGESACFRPIYRLANLMLVLLTHRSRRRAVRGCVAYI